MIGTVPGELVADLPRDCGGERKSADADRVASPDCPVSRRPQARISAYVEYMQRAHRTQQRQRVQIAATENGAARPDAQ